MSAPRIDPGIAVDILDALDMAFLVLDEQLLLAQPASAATCRLLRRDLPVGTTLTDALAAIRGAGAPETATQLARAVLAAADGTQERAAIRALPFAPTGAAPGVLVWYDLEFRLLATSPRSVLIGFNDVTAQHDAVQQLEQARTAHELVLAVLHAEPQSLQLFLDTATASMSLVHSLLRMPARSETAFRDKLERIFAEMRSLADDADALQLRAIAQLAEGFATALNALRARGDLNGDDLLPLAPRLDELFGQIAVATALQEERGSVNGPDQHHFPGAAAEARSVKGSEEQLRALASRIAADHQREVSLLVLGLVDVPAAYRHSVDSMLAHLVRNAIEHGIETPQERLDAGKSAAGTLIVEFSVTGAQGYELMVQDDGQGFDVERIGRVAVERGLLSHEALGATDPRKLVGLIFRPGFSTAGADDAEGSGRGLGMEFLRELVTRLGGNISVATKRGRYTRFKVSLPATDAQQDLESEFVAA